MSVAVQPWLSWCGTGLAACTMGYSIAACLAVRLRRGHSLPGAGPMPPVTVLKPVCGGERDLYECLRSFCEQAYPRFQVVFGAQAPDDPAIAVVRRLQGEFQGLDLQMVINQARHGSSGKVSNLINMMPLARYDYLVVADSDIRVTPDYLAKVVPPLLGSDVGIVTCAYRGRSRPESWSILESAFINDWFMPSVYVAAMLGSRAFAFGATIALRREVLARIGGFGLIADQLADDYRLGELTRRIGLRTILSDAVVETSVHERSCRDLVRHQLRWLRTIRAVRPGGYALSFMTLGLAPAAFGAWAAAGARAAMLMLTITAVARLMLHFGSRNARTALLELWVVPVGDLLVFALWCWGFVTSRVQWHQVLYRVRPDGSLHPITRRA